MGENFFCGFGVNLTNRQIALLKRKFEHIIIMFDSDKAGRENSNRLAATLSAIGIKITMIEAFADYLKNGKPCKDAGDLSRKQAKNLISELYSLFNPDNL